MTTKMAAGRWIADYVRAWESNDPAEIAVLFTEDATTYQPTPMSDPRVGRDEIVAGWLNRKDEASTWTFESEVVAVDGDLAVIRGTTRYVEPYPTFENIWLVSLDDGGMARSFIEYWMKHD